MSLWTASVQFLPESLASILHSARANTGWRWVALYMSPEVEKQKTKEQLLI